MMKNNNKNNSKNTPFSYPYNFVSLGDINEIKREKRVKGEHSGKIKCSLKNLTPIFIGNKTDEKEEKTLTLKVEGNEKYVIPASTLKGEIRNIIEVLTTSCIKNVEEERLDYRGKAGERKNVFGIIEKFPTANDDGIIIEADKVKVNRKKVDSSYILAENDVINIFIYEEELEKLIVSKSKKYSYSKKLDIVYEDENIIVMNKPKNLLSHASSKEDYGNNLVDFMIGYLLEKGDYNPRAEKTFVPAIINRLDRNTSGLVIGAKNSKALRQLNKLKENSIEKYYKTIVSGKVKKNFVINEKIEKDEEKNKSTISKNGKDSITEVYVEKNNDDFSLLKIKLITGRTHQIRVHMAHIGHPLLGDLLYKGPCDIFDKRQALHSYYFECDHPVTKTRLKIKTTMPADIKELISKLESEL